MSEFSRIVHDAKRFPRDTSSWIQTFSGQQFWPLNPRAGDVNILDIAHALSMLCRYNGHCARFYSVAEHSVHVSRAVDTACALEGLLHDAAEAYLADVPRPVKPHLTGFREIEGRLDRVIAETFGLTYPWPKEVHRADAALLADERAALMGPAPAPWSLTEQPLGIEIQCWDPEQAKWEFVKRFLEVSR